MLSRRVLDGVKSLFAPSRARRGWRDGRLGKANTRRARFEPLEDRLLLAAGDFEWLDQFGALNDQPAEDWGYQVDADTDGNTYVVGTTAGFLAGVSSSTLGLDAFVRKSDADGNEVWTRQFGTSGDDHPYTVAVSDDGLSVYVAGRVGAALPGQTSEGLGDAFLRKYDADGNELWTHQFGTPGWDVVFYVCVDGSNVYVAGTAGGALPGQDPLGDPDAFVRKYDADGTERWTYQFGGEGRDDAWGLAIDAEGYIYVAGETSGSVSGESPIGDWDAFICKLEEKDNGTYATEVWTKQFGTTAEDWACGVSVDPYGDVYVVGATQGSLGDAGPFGADDAFVRKYKPDGRVVWTHQFGSELTAAKDWALYVAADSSGVYVSGLTEGSLPGETNAGGMDAFVCKYALDGSGLLWTDQFGTSADDEAQVVSVEGSAVYVAGSTLGTLPNQTSSGQRDAFIRKYTPDGYDPAAGSWTRQFGGGQAVEDWAAGAPGIDSDGNVYVWGEVEDGGTFPGQTGSGGDYFLRMYDSSHNVIWTRPLPISEFWVRGSTFVEESGVPYLYLFGSGYGMSPYHPEVEGYGLDGFVVKLDLDADVDADNVVWTHQFGSAFPVSDPDGDFGWTFMYTDEHIHDISVDASGVYVVGWVGEDAYVELSYGGYDTLAGNGVPGGAWNWLKWNGYFVKCFVHKLDLDTGDEVWSDSFDSFDSEGLPGLAFASGVFADGTGVYVTGAGGPFPGETEAGGAYVRKYRLDGTRELDWTWRLGVDADVWGSEVFVDESWIYVAGRVGGGIFVSKLDKLDPQRAPEWLSEFGTSSGFDYATGLVVDASGVYVAGYTQGALPGQTSAGSEDAFVRAYDTDGNEIWTRQFGTPGDDGMYGVSLDESGVYVAGWVYGALPGQTWMGDYDSFVAKLAKSQPPTADAGEPYTVGEGGSIPLDGSASTDPDQDPATLTYEWDFDYDGAFVTDATGISPTFSAAGLDGPTSRTVALRVTDDEGKQDTATATVDVTNVDPAITFEWAQIDELGLFTASGSFTDPGPDQWTAWVDYGEGAGEEPLALTGKTFVLNHQYPIDTPPETYRVVVRVADDDGGSDIRDSGALIVKGGPDGDLITVEYGSVVVVVNDQTLGSFEDISKVFVVAGPGNDEVRVDSALAIPTLLLGGAGDDILEGGSGNDVLDGGDGQDVLLGGDGQDALVGGEGDDQLDGGPGDDDLQGGAGNDQLLPGSGDDSMPEVGYNFQIVGPVSLTPGSDAVRGQVVSFEASGTGPEVSWTFGDGATDGNVLSSSHVYADSGTYDVGLVVEADTETTTVVRPVQITAAAIQEDLCDPTKTALVVGGTTQDDHILFNPGVASEDVAVKIDGASLGIFQPTGSLIAYGQAGNDTIELAASIELAAWLYGNAGDDRLKGGAGHDVLLGGDGADLLVGKSGRDILIGGMDADRIIGNADDDILIAGYLTFMDLEHALCAIRQEWISTDRDYMDRVENLTDQQNDPDIVDSRLNDNYFLIWGSIDPNDDTVKDDGASDILTGSAGTDWFFFNQDDDHDRATDLKDEIFANDLSWIEV